MSAAPKFTPGPWRAGPVFKQDGLAIFWTDTSKPGKWQRRVDADGVFPKVDACLIAAAPDLYAALVAASAALEAQLNDPAADAEAGFRAAEAARAALARVDDRS